MLNTMYVEERGYLLLLLLLDTINVVGIRVGVVGGVGLRLIIALRLVLTVTWAVSILMF